MYDTQQTLYKITKRYNLAAHKMICEVLSNPDKDIIKPDAVVVMTNRQRQDFEEQCGSRELLFVIPNCIGKVITKVDFKNRMPFHAICLAAYRKEKQHTSLIRAFQKVIQKHPNARLDLYGSGSEKTVITNQIRDLALENNIFVHDFADNVEEIYNSASLAVLTSLFEGFCLFLLESIMHGCPVVSYDIDYGPSDLIDEDVNGYLIEPNNEEEMARKITELFSSEEKMISMSEASYRKAEMFQAEAVARMYQNLLETIIQRRK
jgi:poly(glycerol-phosphate) alpha-glucosyltransferase